MTSKEELERLLTLLNEKEIQVREGELALAEQQEEFMSQKEELNAAVEELISKNAYLSDTLEQLRRRNQELDQILYRASHDLKTPVSSLLGLNSLMASTGMTPEQVSIWGHMTEKTRQMAALLASFSDLSTAFYHELAFETCSIREVIDKAWEGLEVNDNAVFLCRLEEIYFKTDPFLLGILLTSLLKNAATYSIENSVNEIVVDGSVSDSMLSLSIADNGEEISPQVSENIFDMFYRGSIRSQGPGLGLYIAKRIVERLRGEITFINERPTKRFIISLPKVNDD